ncbi:unnamed protein product [Discula destructiva]
MSWIAERDLHTGVMIDHVDVSPSDKFLVAVLLGIAIYNALEVIPVVYFTFPKFSGLYFWSVLVADFGVIIYATGFVLANFGHNGHQILSKAMTIAGWLPMVVCQSLVLYSRLHLINLNERLRQGVLIMMILNDTAMGISTAVCSAGSIGKYAPFFVLPFAVIERTQVTAFFLQELILSGLYVWKAWAYLYDYGRRKVAGKNRRVEEKLRRMMMHLIISSVVVVSLDMTIIGLEFAGLFFFQVAYKAFVYSVKLKCELCILNRLVDFVKSSASPYNRKHDQSHCRRPHNRRWPHSHFRVHRCHDADCQGGGGGGSGGGSGGEKDEDGLFQLSSQTEREWQMTLRNTFGGAVNKDDEGERVVGDEEGGSGRRAAASCSGSLNSPPAKKCVTMAGEQVYDDDYGHPGQRVLGLYTIASTGDERSVVDESGGGGGDNVARRSALSYSSLSSGAAVWSTSLSLGERSVKSLTMPPVPERSHLREKFSRDL